MTKSISIQNLYFAYKGKQKVFHDFTLHLVQPDQKGKVTAIMGSSGSGKTTLMKLLLGIEKQQQGLLKITPSNPVIAYVPQEPVLFEHMSVADNAAYFKFAGAYKKRFNEHLYNSLVESLDLSDVLAKGKSVMELSGGQKQRLGLLRALSIEPDILLLDEPCNGLDAAVKRSFLNKLREITEQYGLFVLYITHHKLEAQLVADEVVYLVQDKITGVVSSSAQASIETFMKKPPVLEAAQVFRFPDVKLLPVYLNGQGTPEIAGSENDISQYWLVEEENISINAKEGWPFKLVSKSPVYAVIRHEASMVEWMMPTGLFKDVEAGSMIWITLNNKTTAYSKDGFLIN